MKLATWKKPIFPLLFLWNMQHRAFLRPYAVTQSLVMKLYFSVAPVQMAETDMPLHVCGHNVEENPSFLK